MSVLFTLAAKEVRDSFRNRVVIAATLLLALLALALGFLGSAPTGSVGASPLAVTVVSLASLSVFLVPLIALTVAHDAVVGEVERGTMLLLLSYPVARWQAVLGKFLGHVAVLAIATVVGFGLGGAALAWAGGNAAEGWWPFAALIGSSVLLGAAFLAIGYLISTLAPERPTAAGLAVAAWLLFVLVYDAGLLGLLAAGEGGLLAPGLFRVLLLLNPADVYRLFNLTGFEEVRSFSGLLGVAEEAALSPALLLGVLLAWVLVPLAAATAVFARKAI